MVLWQELADAGGMVASLLCRGMLGLATWDLVGASPVLVTPWSATAVAPPGR